MSNRLADATSPYLRQHADNPVDWYPWGPEALARAREQDRPILLSVGYSACHWCHVMAHESFEDEATAALMNEHFVSVKVDREERPDIDAIYQKVVALMGQGGGWPLTVFLTPDQRPFYGGTYFPPADRYGRPGFPRLLAALAELWATRRDDAIAQAETFMRGFADIAAAVDEGAPEGLDLRLTKTSALVEAATRLLVAVDKQWGGFGRAPKFPSVSALELLLTLVRGDPDADPDADPKAQLVAEARAAVRLSLDKMARGGIYDQLRGGFARYSTDREWLVPHFEKMLYDNGALLGLYAEASVCFDDPRLRAVVEQTADYLVEDMRSEAGTFYAATDADSEGVEGKYFCWTPAQLDAVLGPELGARFAAVYGVSEAGNFEHGLSILHLGDDTREAEIAELAPARAALLAARAERVAPQRDDKIITAWNALTISGFCRAAEAALAWPDPGRRAAWIEVAEAAAADLLTRHRDGEGRLLRAAWAGVGHTRAVVEDVALLGRACLDLHQLSLDPRWHAEAEALARELCDHYARDGGGLFTTADDGEALIERTESQHDGPLPSGLAAGVELLARLELGGPAGHDLPPGIRDQLDQTLSRFARAAAQPRAFAALIDAARWLGPRATHVTIRAPTRAAAEPLAAVVWRRRVHAPDPLALRVDLDGERDHAEALVCRAQTCSLPLASPEALAAALEPS